MRSFVRPSFYFLALSWSFPSLCQNHDDLFKPAILASHSPQLKDKKFSFEVQVSSDPRDKRSASLVIICSKGLKCSPAQQSVSLSSPKLAPFSAEEVDDLNSAEIDATLAIDGGKTLAASQVIDFGLEKALYKIVSNAPSTFRAGESRSLIFWLEDSQGLRVKPTSTVFITVTRSTDCAGIKTVPKGIDESTIQYGRAASANINEWTKETLDAVLIRPNRWNQGPCSLEVVLSSADQPSILRTTVLIPTDPDYGTAAAACLLGGLVQYLIAALVQIVLLARAQRRVDVYQIYVGANGVEIIEMLLKGTLSFLMAAILNTTNLVQFKGANNNSLLGYGVFAFLIGFWQLKPLWEAFSKLSRANEKAPEAEHELNTDKNKMNEKENKVETEDGNKSERVGEDTSAQAGQQILPPELGKL